MHLHVDPAGSTAKNSRHLPRLMMISSGSMQSVDAFDETAWRRSLSAAAENGAAVQLREKSLPSEELRGLACWVREHFAGTLLINGDVDVALDSGADGVHFPSLAEPPTRVLDGSCSWWVGRSCHRLDEVERAAVAGFDYVTFSPIFPTTSKPGHPGVGVELLEGAARIDLPVFALGGVDETNAARCLRAGAWGIAAIRALSHPERCGRMRQIVEQTIR